MNTPSPAPATAPTPLPRTPDEILARMTSADVVERDQFGVERSRYLEALPHEKALPYLKADSPLRDPAAWAKVQMTSTEGVRAAIADYLTYAWQKANTRRALSSLRSLCHFAGLLWLLRSDEADRVLEQLPRWACYGKPQLVMVAEMIGFDWRAADDGAWVVTKDDGTETIRTADEVLGR